MKEDGLFEGMNSEIDLFRPHDETWLKNKFYYYNIIRQLDILYYSKEYNLFVVTDYKHALDILKNHQTYLSGHGNLIVESPERFGNTPVLAILLYILNLKVLLKIVIPKILVTIYYRV